MSESIKKSPRVNPAGELAFPSARGTLMGNRGCLHDDHGVIVRKAPIKSWVSCLTEVKGEKRERLKPGYYTELFFLDEATALAAGHRPCHTCRGAEARLFSKFWSAGNRQGETTLTREIDAVLDKERSEGERIQVESTDGLPDGTIVRQEASANFYLLHRGLASQWSFDGYSKPVPASSIAGPFRVMTPASIVRALRAGYQPKIHQSAYELAV